MEKVIEREELDFRATANYNLGYHLPAIGLSIYTPKYCITLLLPKLYGWK